MSGAAHGTVPVAAAPPRKAVGLGLLLPVRRLEQPACYARDPRMFVVVVDHLLSNVAVVVVIDAGTLPVADPVAAVGNVVGSQHESLALAPKSPVRH